MNTHSRWTQILYLTIVLGLMLESSLNAGFILAQPEPDRHDILFLIDNSGSIEEFDPDEQRLRFPRFLVRYLQAFVATETRVGAVAFATAQKSLVPLVPASEWSHADLLDIRSLECEGQFCENTRFSDAISYAAEQFAMDPLDEDSGELPCGTSEDGYRRCDIIIFSDGIFADSDDRYDGTDDVVASVRDELEALDPDINVWVAMLGEGPDVAASVAGLEPQDILDSEETWQQFAQDGLIGGFAARATTLGAEKVYSTTLSHLGLDDDLEQMEIQPVEDEANILLPIAPFRHTVQLRYLTDGFIEDGFVPAPTVATDINRWWIDDVPSQIEWTLAGDGLVYYQVLSEPHSLALQSQVLPQRQAVGGSEQFYAWITLDQGQIVTDVEGFEIQAVVEPPDKSYLLEPGEAGVFGYTLPVSDAGEYKVTFQVVEAPPFAPSLIGEVSEGFVVGHIPELHLDVGQVISDSKLWVPVSITVAHYDTIAGVVTPTLESGEPVTDVELTWDTHDLFTATVELPVTGSVPIWAKLPGGQTHSGLSFPMQMIQTGVATHLNVKGLPPDIEPAKNNTWQSIAFGLLGIALLVGLTAIVLVIWFVLRKLQKRRNKAEETTLMAALVPHTERETVEKAIREMEKEKIDHMWPYIIEYGRVISQLHRQGIDSRN